jgi:hypothetical protein
MPVLKKSAVCELKLILTPPINSCRAVTSTCSSGGSRSEWDHGCKVGGQTTPSWKYSSSSASSCTRMRMRIVMEEHYTEGQHSTLFVLNGRPYAVFLVFRNIFLTTLWPIVAWILPSALLSCPSKQLPLAFWQKTFVYIFRYIWCMCLHAPFWLLFGFSIHKWNQSFIICYNLTEKLIAIVVVSL